MTNASAIIKELHKLADPKRAKVSARFFKTGPGQYGAGDKFLGIAVPALRKIAHKYNDLSFSDIIILLKNPVHEHRFVALEILVAQYECGDETTKKRIVDFYLRSTKYINNWDLVDTSAEYILGDYLFDKPKKILYKLAKSKNLWERRMAIIATHHFIKRNQFTDTRAIAEILLHDTHDLIHKAVGWMLREVGKRSRAAELRFLDAYGHRMPRTMLRYAVEKFSPQLRRHYLTKGLRVASLDKKH